MVWFTPAGRGTYWIGATSDGARLIVSQTMKTSSAGRARLRQRGEARGLPRGFAAFLAANLNKCPRCSSSPSARAT